MKKIVEVNHISKSFGYRYNKVHVLNNISFSIDQGEFVGIMGPSGAGKTTLLNIISTTLLPDAGMIQLNGQNILRMRDNQLSDFRRKKLGFIFQNFSLIDTLNIKDNILLPLAVDHFPIKEMKRRLMHVTKVLGIEELLTSYPANISIGQRQRVTAARALIIQPELIFADEPTGSLDSKSAAELLRYMSEMNAQDKTTILMVTHDPYTASYCNRILFIKDGTIFSEIHRRGTRKEFFDQVIDMQATIGGSGKANDFQNNMEKD